jgi:hypothetical protein
MMIHTVLLLALGVGIFVGLKTKKLTVTELLVCGMFGLLLAGTPVGQWVNKTISDVSGAAFSSLTAWLS